MSTCGFPWLLTAELHKISQISQKFITLKSQEKKILLWSKMLASFHTILKSSYVEKLGNFSHFSQAQKIFCTISHCIVNLLYFIYGLCILNIWKICKNVVIFVWDKWWAVAVTKVNQICTFNDYFFHPVLCDIFWLTDKQGWFSWSKVLGNSVICWTQSMFQYL